MSVKYDEGKPRLGLFPTEAILAGGRALTYGVAKYNDYNYKNGEGLDWNRYYDALLRHLFAWIGGEDKDKESGLSHLDHMMACSAMLTDAVNSGIGKDTRFYVDKGFPIPDLKAVEYTRTNYMHPDDSLMFCSRTDRGQEPDTCPACMKIIPCECGIQ